MSEHEHEFIGEKYTIQKLATKYMSEGKTAQGIVNIEIPYIFCVKCGEIKKVEVETEK